MTLCTSRPPIGSRVRHGFGYHPSRVFIVVGYYTPMDKMEDYICCMHDGDDMPYAFKWRECWLVGAEGSVAVEKPRILVEGEASWEI